jgi:hypothetical protein
MLLYLDLQIVVSCHRLGTIFAMLLLAGPIQRLCVILNQAKPDISEIPTTKEPFPNSDKTLSFVDSEIGHHT